MDLLVKNGNVVFPNRFVRKVDLLITDGLISKIGLGLEEGDQVIDAGGKYVFPGVIDSHFHAGIYRPLSLDARSESASAVAGGVTTLLSYFRTGRYYMNSSAPYTTLFNEVLKQSAGNYYTDYGYHLAPITRKHLEEMPYLTREYGITTYKYYMFFRGIDASVPRDGDPSKGYLLSADPYDMGHLQRVMAQVVKIRREIKDTVRLSIHAEDPELNRVSSEDVQSSSEGLSPLQMNNKARPPESERFALIQAAELANQTGCPINILHLSSKMGLETIAELKRAYPKLDMIVETAPHYLVLDDRYGSGSYGKVFPPIRTPVDSEALWEGIASGQIDTVASDHCCSNAADKSSDIWSSKAGFGGIELLLPSVITGGHMKRQIGLERLAALMSYNPARYFGLSGKKGDIAVGCDADLAICDLSKTRTVKHSELHSAQDFSPFDGLELTGWPDTTILRGMVVYDHGVVGDPRGEYLNRSRSAPHPVPDDVAPSRQQ
jgi:dihydroorotase-like cyclic amidohydrolase